MCVDTSVDIYVDTAVDMCVDTAVDIWMTSPDVLEVLGVAGPGHQHAVTLGHGGRQHRQPHYQTVVTRASTYSGVHRGNMPSNISLLSPVKVP